MLKQLLNRNNGLLLIVTPNNADLSLTCPCWMFLWLWSVIVIFQSKLKYWVWFWNSVGIFKIQSKSWILIFFSKFIKSGFSIYGCRCWRTRARGSPTRSSRSRTGSRATVARRPSSATRCASPSCGWTTGRSSSWRRPGAGRPNTPTCRTTRNARSTSAGLSSATSSARASSGRSNTVCHRNSWHWRNNKGGLGTKLAGCLLGSLVAVVDLIGIAFDFLFSMLGHQEEHPACKIEWWGFWCGYLSAARCRLFAYGPADATASTKHHHLLPHLSPERFYLSGTGLPRLSWKRGRV